MKKKLFSFAIALILGITSAYAQSAQERFNRANNYVRNGQIDQAIAEYDAVIEMQPNDSGVYYNRAYAYFTKDDYGKAIDDFTKSISIMPHASAYYGRGVAYWKNKNPELAIADYNKAIEIDPNYANAYCNRGVVYAENGKPEQAIADFTKALELNPRDALAYAGRSKTYHNIGKDDLALADANKAESLGYAMGPGFVAKLNKTSKTTVSQDPAREYFEKGNANYVKRDFYQAIDDFTKSIDTDSTRGVTFHNRGLTYFALRDYDKAWADVRKAEALGYPTNPGFLENLKRATEFESEIRYREFTMNEMGRIFKFKGSTNCSQQLIRDMLPGITGFTDGDAKEFMIKTEFVKWGEAGKYWEEDWTVETANKKANFLLTLTPTPDGGANYQIKPK